MRPRLSFALLAPILLAAAPAAAQTRVSLPEAVRQAAERHPGVLAASAAVDEALAALDVARAAWLPRVSFAESWQRSNQPVFAFSSLLAARQFKDEDFATSRLNDPGAVAAFAGRFMVSQVLFDERTGAATDAGSARLDAARAALAERRAAVALEVTRVYGRALVADAERAAAEGALTAAREQVERADRRRTAGLVTDADVLAFSVHAAAMDRRRIDAVGRLRLAYAELNRLMGEPVNRTLLIVEPSAPSPVTADIDTLFKEAEAARPELRRVEADRRAAVSRGRLARAGWLPRIQAQAGYQFEGLALLDRADSWIIGGEVTWSLSTGGAERAEARAARAALVAADAQLADTRAGLQLEIVQALVSADTARARLLAGSRAVAEASERERIVRNRYDAGLAGVSDVLTAAAASLDAELERVAAMADAMVAAAMFDRAVGRPAGDVQP